MEVFRSVQGTEKEKGEMEKLRRRMRRGPAHQVKKSEIIVSSREMAQRQQAFIASIRQGEGDEEDDSLE